MSYFTNINNEAMENSTYSHTSKSMTNGKVSTLMIQQLAKSCFEPDTEEDHQYERKEALEKINQLLAQSGLVLKDNLSAKSTPSFDTRNEKSDKSFDINEDLDLSSAADVILRDALEDEKEELDKSGGITIISSQHSELVDFSFRSELPNFSIREKEKSYNNSLSSVEQSPKRNRLKKNLTITFIGITFCLLLCTVAYLTRFIQELKLENHTLTEEIKKLQRNQALIKKEHDSSKMENEQLKYQVKELISRQFTPSPSSVLPFLSNCWVQLHLDVEWGQCALDIGESFLSTLSYDNRADHAEESCYYSEKFSSMKREIKKFLSL